ncbi:hypothetical protein F4801DRAFT_5300 [Xylaria longipes]|nr:hypothetical protein F4801DRAFT_5300 [Xylaria longipes]
MLALVPGKLLESFTPLLACLRDTNCFNGHILLLQLLQAPEPPSNSYYKWKLLTPVLYIVFRQLPDFLLSIKRIAKEVYRKERKLFRNYFLTAKQQLRNGTAKVRQPEKHTQRGLYGGSHSNAKARKIF